MNRYPMAFLEMNPADSDAIGAKAGDIVEVFNDYGSTYAMVYPSTAIKRNQTFMLFGYPKAVAGDVTTEWVDRNVVPYYKGTWGGIRRVGSMAEYKAKVSFKERRYA